MIWGVLRLSLDHGVGLAVDDIDIGPLDGENTVVGLQVAQDVESGVER